MSEAASEDAPNNEAFLIDSASKPVTEGSDADDESEILSDEEDPIVAQKQGDLTDANGNVEDDQDLNLTRIDNGEKVDIEEIPGSTSSGSDYTTDLSLIHI